MIRYAGIKPPSMSEYAMAKKELEKQLTKNQIEVLKMLREQHCYLIATITEQNWKSGKSYYIDDRVKVRGIRRKYNQGNREAVKQ